MQAKRLVGAAVLALAVAGIGGPAQAAVGAVPADHTDRVAAANLDGYEIVSEMGTTDNVPVLVTCPAGKVATGGGVRPVDHSIIVNSSWPTGPEDNGWVGSAGERPGFGPTAIEVYAVCVNA